MKGYELEGVEGIFIHLETKVEAVALRSLVGQVYGSGEYNNATVALYYILRDQFKVIDCVQVEVRPSDNAFTLVGTK